MCSHSHGPVHCVQNVPFHEVALSQHPDRCTVAVQQGPMLGQLFELDLGHGHERIDLMLRTVEVLDAEGVDGNDLDARLVADLEYLREY
jgi:hypothetical protein